MEDQRHKEHRQTQRALHVVAAVVLILIGLGTARLIDTWQFAASGAPNATATATATIAPAVSTPVVEVPGSEIQDLPRYPTSRRSAYSQTTTAELRVTAIDYVTADDLQEVHRHYRQVFTTYAWFVADLEFTRDERTFFIIRDAREARVLINDLGDVRHISLVHSEPLRSATATPRPRPTPTPQARPSPTPSPSPTATATATPPPTATATATPTATPEPPPPPPPPEPEPPQPPPPVPDDGGEDDDWDDDDDDDD
jgi:hypothetical protein